MTKKTRRRLEDHGPGLCKGCTNAEAIDVINDFVRREQKRIKSEEYYADRRRKIMGFLVPFGGLVFLLGVGFLVLQGTAAVVDRPRKVERRNPEAIRQTQFYAEAMKTAKAESLAKPAPTWRANEELEEWTPLQEKQFLKALGPLLGLPPKERWRLVAEKVEGKDHKECASHYKLQRILERESGRGKQEASNVLFVICFASLPGRRRRRPRLVVVVVAVAIGDDARPVSGGTRLPARWRRRPPRRRRSARGGGARLGGGARRGGGPRRWREPGHGPADGRRTGNTGAPRSAETRARRRRARQAAVLLELGQMRLRRAASCVHACTTSVRLGTSSSRRSSRCTRAVRRQLAVRAKHRLGMVAARAVVRRREGIENGSPVALGAGVLPRPTFAGFFVSTQRQ